MYLGVAFLFSAAVRYCRRCYWNYLRRRLASEGIVALGVTLSRCVRARVCVRRAAYITYRLCGFLIRPLSAVSIEWFVEMAVHSCGSDGSVRPTFQLLTNNWNTESGKLIKQRSNYKISPTESYDTTCDRINIVPRGSKTQDRKMHDRTTRCEQ